MTPNHHKTVNVFFEKKKVSLRDEDCGISFEYDMEQKQLNIKRYMHTDPFRHIEEYEKRKLQLQTRMEHIDFPHQCWIAEPHYAIASQVTIGLAKADATPEHISAIRDILIDLSKEDYEGNSYSKHQFGDDFLYVEAFHFRLLRAMLVSADGKIERFSEEMLVSESYRFDLILEEAAEMSILDHATISDIIEPKVFEDLWEEGN